MSLDMTVLRLLKYREKYDNYNRQVPLQAVSEQTKILMQDFGAFFKEFPEVSSIQAGPFMLWFKGFRHPNLKPEAASIYESVFTEVCSSDVEPGVEAGIVERLVAADTANRVLKLIEQWTEGGEVDLYSELRANVERFENLVDRKVKNPQVLDPIEDLLKAEEDDTGFHWRLQEMNDHFKPLRSGDFYVVAARPDKGKTSFISDQGTHLAAQVDLIYPDEGRSILWFNNEGPGKQIILRNFQAALNATTEDLVRLNNLPPVDPTHRTLLREQYVAALGGRGGTLRVFDIHDFWNHEVEDLMRKFKPAGVIWDMIDNIKFGGEASNNGQRTDQLLEAMYQWARFMCVKYDCWGIATSQISADGDGLQFPTLPMLKDSKTGKQGAADVIITLGASNDPSLENSRYIGATKNKRGRTGRAKSPTREVLFDRDRSRYNSAPI